MASEDGCRMKEMFKSKFGEVVLLMLTNRLRDDMDDGLLEKLLTVIQNGFGCDELDDVLQNYNLVQLYCSVLESLESRSDEFPPDVVSFALRTMGIVLRKPDFFALLQTRDILTLLCSLVKENQVLPYEPSVQVAILFVLTNLTRDGHGRGFLRSQGPKFFKASHCFLSASSHYVRKDAVEFYVSFLTNLIPEYTALPLDKLLDFILRQLVLSVKNIGLSEEDSMCRDSSVLIINACMEKHTIFQHLFCHRHALMDEIVSEWQKAETFFKPSDAMLSLVVECVPYNRIDENLHLLAVLLKHKMVCETMTFHGKLWAREENRGKKLFNLGDKNVGVKLMLDPLIMLQESEDEMSLFTEYVDNENDIKAVVLTVFSILSKFAHILDEDGVEFVMKNAQDIYSNSVRNENTTLLLRISKNQKLLSFVCGTVTRLVESSKFDTIRLGDRVLFADCLLEVTEKSLDCRVTCANLKLIRTLLQKCLVVRKHFAVTSAFGEVLQRKLFDPQWAVVDSCVEVVRELVTLISVSDSPDVWLDVIFKYGFHTSLWDIALVSQAEGYVRASCIAVLTLMSLVPKVFEDLERQRSASKDSFISSLCVLSEHPDIFIQRESVSSLVQWLNLKDLKANAQIFSMFVNIIRSSLDCEAKRSTLVAWRTVCETYFSTSDIKENTLHDVLQFLCDVGYGFSVVSASLDCDRTVQSEAVKELLRLRQFLTESGYTMLSLKFDEDVQQSLPSCSSDTQPGSFPVVSQEEVQKAISDVLDIDTTKQIQMLISPSGGGKVEAPAASGDGCSSLCPPAQLWKAVWSAELEVTLESSVKSSDIYVDNPIALLDDIVSAKRGTDVVMEGEYQDADCY